MTDMSLDSFKEQARVILLHFREKEENNPAYELHVMARGEMRNGRHDQAREYCARALHLAEDLGQPYSKGAAHMILGVIHLDRADIAGGDLKSAQEHFQQAGEVFGHAGRRYERGVALLAMGWVLLDQWKRNLDADRSDEVFRYYRPSGKDLDFLV